MLKGGTWKLPAFKIGDVPSPIFINTMESEPVSQSSVHTTHNKVPSANSDTIGMSKATITKVLSKGECLGAQTKTMLAMTRIIEGSSEARGNSMAAS